MPNYERAVLAGKLWDAFRSRCYYRGTCRKTFGQLGVSTQNVWLAVAAAARRELAPSGSAGGRGRREAGAETLALYYLGRAIRCLVPEPSRSPTYDDARSARVLVQRARGELLGYYEGPASRRRLVPPSSLQPAKARGRGRSTRG